MVHLLNFKLALILLPLVSAQVVEECPGSEGVLQEVCTFNSRSESAVEFRRKTRLDYNVTDKTDDDNSLAFAPLFSPRPGYARCVSKCPGIDRSDVTWCVRLAYVDDTIEFCVSLGDGDQLVFNSTCNTEALGIQVEEHLSLPNRFGCLLGGGPGCLALNNLNWFFRDAYLTCISETENCRDVSFASILHSNNLVQPPSIEEPTVLPMRIQPADQIIIRAVITSSSPRFFINWMHNNITYMDHIKENPICPGTEDNVCSELEKHVTIFQTARLGTDCSTLSIIEAYLIIDSATESDAGTYLLNVTAVFQKAQTSVKTIDINIECDETQLFKAQCSNTTIVKDKGSNVRWQCSVKAPHNSSLSVAVNNTHILQKSDLAGKESLDKICTLGEPTAMYDVVEEEQHLCYTKYTVMVTVCSAAKELVGNYSIVFDEGNIAQGSGVYFKLTTSPALVPSSECDEAQFFKALCSNTTIVKDKGSNVRWLCSVKAPHNSSLSVAVNNTHILQKSDLAGKGLKSLDKICTLGEPTAMYDVFEEQHLCYKRYTVVVTVCSAAKELEGNYSIVFDEGNIAQGSGVNFKLTLALAPSSGENSSSVSEAVNVVPLAILVLYWLGSSLQ